MATPKEPSKISREKNTGLKKCFSALVDRKQVNLELDVLKLMLKHELQINTDVLDENLSAVLPFMLAFYIKNWPGWQRAKEYYSGKLNFKDWFEKFRQYIVLRLNYLIKNGYNLAIDMLKNDLKKDKPASLKDVTLKTQGSQTDYAMPKSIAPFTITIECPPMLMGCLIFTENGDDLVVRSHPEIPWAKIGVRELLNWPHVSMELVSPEIQFKRKCCGEYQRFVNLNNTYINVPKDTEFIEKIDLIDATQTRSCYSLNLLRVYLNEYANILKSVKGMQKDVEVVELLFEEFLKDIEDINVNNSMASNTSVLFNIGRSTFLRNKKIGKNTNASYISGSKLDICYNELFIPKMETSLYYFKGIQDMSTPEISFSYLNILKAALANTNYGSTSSTFFAMPSVRFTCEFCVERFTTPYLLMDHLDKMHKLEPSYICRTCKTTCPINQLSSKRWVHTCSDPSKKNPPAVASRV